MKIKNIWILAIILFLASQVYAINEINRGNIKGILGGGCCLPDNSCNVTLTEDDCTGAGGTFQGMDVSCTPNPCTPSGACCPYISNICSVTSSLDCSLSGGAYQGDASVCSPNPCSATGACCLSNMCVVRSSALCSNMFGTYQGDNIACTVGLCVVETPSFLFVADYGNNRIQVFNNLSPWAYVDQFGSYGIGNGEFDGPYGLAVDADYIYVTDNANARVQIFNKSNYNYVDQFSLGNNGTGISVSDSYVYALIGGADITRYDKTSPYSPVDNVGNSFLVINPSGITLDSNYIYVTDGDFSTVASVSVFDQTSLGLVCRFGSYGIGNGQFDSPVEIKVDADYIYVADYGNDRIQVMDKTVDSDLYAAKFSTQSSYLPYDVEIDASYIYVVNGDDNVIQIYDKSDYSYTGAFGSFGTGNGEFDGPIDLAVDASYIYVADSGNNRIQIFDIASPWAYVGQFGSFGTGNGEFNAPEGISVTASYIYISDLGNQRVQIFDVVSPWAYVDQFATEGSVYPGKIVVYEGDTIYVGDTDNNLVQVYQDSSPWTYQESFGSGITSIGGITFSAVLNNFYVVDIGGNKIQTYGLYNYVLIREYGSLGIGDGEFQYPLGIAADSLSISDEHLYIADSDNLRIQVLNSLPSCGTYVGQFGSTGSGDGQFTSPWGISINSNYIYVTDSGNDRVQIFDKAAPYGFVGKFGSTGSGNGEFTLPAGIVQPDEYCTECGGGGPVE